MLADLFSLNFQLLNKYSMSSVVLKKLNKKLSLDTVMGKDFDKFIVPFLFLKVEFLKIIQ